MSKRQEQTVQKEKMQLAKGHTKLPTFTYSHENINQNKNYVCLNEEKF